MTIAQTQNTAEQLLRDAGILPVVTVDTLDRRVAWPTRCSKAACLPSN